MPIRKQHLAISCYVANKHNNHPEWVSGAKQMKVSSHQVLMGLAVHHGLPAATAIPSLHTRPESEDTGILHRGVHSSKEESGTLTPRCIVQAADLHRGRPAR